MTAPLSSLPALLDGRVVAQSVYERLRADIAARALRITLGAIQVGDNRDSASYIGQKRKFAQQIGMGFDLRKFDEDISEVDLLAAVHDCNTDPNITGFIVQLPLPRHIDTNKVIRAIDPTKDVDGFTPVNIGEGVFLGQEGGFVSCTPKGVMEILKYYNIPLRGKKVVVLGRSNIVGKPIDLLLINAGATVTVCNSVTPDIKEYTRIADIVVCATGQPHLLTPEHVRPGTIIIDVGFKKVKVEENADEKEKWIIYGDADTQALVAHGCPITPVPGGVGAMTVAMLLQSTYEAGVRQLGHTTK